jgi:hypothetical protein
MKLEGLRVKPNWMGAPKGRPMSFEGRMKRRRMQNTLSIVFVAGVVLTGCNSGKTTATTASTGTDTAATATAATPTAVSGSDASTEAKQKLTQKQALSFSRMLYENGQIGGGDIEATFVYGPAATFTFTGAIDWKNAQGDVVLNTKVSDGRTVPPQRLLWDKGVMLYELPGLEKAMAAAGRNGVTFVSRPIEKTRSALDLSVTYLASLALTQPLNPLLLRQDPETYWYGGRGEVRGIPVDRFRNGRSTYSADDKGKTIRVETTFKSMSGPATVDFLKLEARQIALPPTSAVVAAADIPEIYAQLTKPQT